MIEYSREQTRAYFASMTRDSRPMAPGVCPLMACYKLAVPSAATGLDPELVGAIDRSLRPSRVWNEMTAGEVLDVIDSLGSTNP